MNDITDLGARRRIQEKTMLRDVKCKCGSLWFLARVTLDENGGVVGRQTGVVCVDCEEFIDV